MNKESLERLLIDRALGQLSPDVEELLVEQLAQNRDMARTAEEFTAVVTLARALTKRPPLTITFRQPFAALIRRERALRIVAMAASFAVGAGLTLWTMRAINERVPHNVVSQTSAQPQPTPRLPAVERAVRTLPFWSNQRIYLVASAARQSNAKAHEQ